MPRSRALIAEPDNRAARVEWLSDTVEKAMRGIPGANESQITTFKAYVERKVAANRDFIEKLLRSKDFQEAFRIQVEYFQSQLKSAFEDAQQIGTKMASSFKTN